MFFVYVCIHVRCAVMHVAGGDESSCIAFLAGTTNLNHHTKTAGPVAAAASLSATASPTLSSSLSMIDSTYFAFMRRTKGTRKQRWYSCVETLTQLRSLLSGPAPD